MGIFKRGLLPLPTLDDVIDKGNIEQLKIALANLSPLELAEIIGSRGDAEHQSAIFSALSDDIALETFDLLPLHTQKRLLRLMPKMQVAAILTGLSPDDRTKFLESLPRKTADELIVLLPYAERMLTLKLLGYPKGSVGRLMTTDYITVKKDWTIEKVLDHIQFYGHDSETIDTLYVIDDQGHLIDDIKLKDCLFVQRNKKVADLCDSRFIALNACDKAIAAIRAFKENDRNALPVIDKDNLLLGIVTIDDVLRLASQQQTKDVQNIGGTEALTEPYLQAPFFELMRKRAGWLILLFLGEMFTATAMGYFENEIEKAVVLALFLPLIISSGGNAGSQASTLVIRAMALGEVKLNDWWKVARLELLSGIFLGVILGIIGFFRITIWSAFSSVYGEYWFLVALTIAIALVGVVLWGTLMGALLPLILRKLGVDPAKSSAPLVATLVDVTGLIIYFSIAMVMLKGSLL